MKKRSLIIIFVLILTLTTFLAACGNDSSSGTGSKAKKTIVIGQMATLTGSAASVGVPQSNGVKMAVKEINDAGGIKVGNDKYKIKLITYDDEGNPQAGATAMQRLLNSDKVKFIVGTVSSAVDGATEPMLRGKNVINVIVGSALAGSTKNPNNYRPRVIIPQYVDATSKYLIDKDVKTVALLTDKQHAGYVNLTDSLIKELEVAGIKVVSNEFYTFGDTNFATQLTSIKKFNPDAINIRGYQNDVVLATMQAKDLGLNSLIVTGSGITTEVEAHNATAAMEGNIDITPPTAVDLSALGETKAKEFIENYRKNFNADPGFTTLSAYGGVYILATAIEKAGTVENIEKIKKEMDNLSVKDVPELVEPILEQNGKIFKDRQASFKMVLREFKDGKFTPVKFLE
ncbi:ABC transporter substrate-binding protein [Neobacillus sp. SAB-20_R2A]|uniref:ABC transporter substrate-binding protein n=1 Tax=Neobacillus sp. SAB-20_R2A TaxID=3120519 RepID=UPI003C6DDAE7